MTDTRRVPRLSVSRPLPDRAHLGRPLSRRRRGAARPWRVFTTLALALTALMCAALAGSRRALRRDEGMSTAEYAVGTVAAVAFAAVLYKVVQSGAVQSALSSIITNALGIDL